MLGTSLEHQQFEVVGFVPKKATLEIVSPPRLELGCVPLTYSGSTGDEDIESELLCVGGGEQADYEGVAAEGKIVLVLQPTDIIPGTYDGLVLTATEHGASGVVFIKSEGPAVSFALPDAAGLTPSVFVSSRDGQRLLMRLSRGRVRVKLQVLASFPKARAHNLVGWIGRDAKSASKILLCSHLDSVLGSPGANDDGSGIATLLEVVKVLQESKLVGRVGFAFFGGEEANYKGSEAFIRADPSELDELRAVISVDQIGVGAGSQNRLCLKTSTIHQHRRIESPEWLTQAITSAGKDVNISVEKTDVPGFSDHVPFMLRGIPGTLIRWMDDPWYHSALDTSFNVDPFKLQKVAVLVVSSALHLAGGR